MLVNILQLCTKLATESDVPTTLNSEQLPTTPITQTMTETTPSKIAWIDAIADEQADPVLKRSLDNARAPSGTVDNVLRVHSLRPHTMDGHVALYRAVLHNDANTLPPWLAETIGSYVCVLNHCTYSYRNHWSNARHLIGNQRRASELSLIHI